VDLVREVLRYFGDCGLCVIGKTRSYIYIVALWVRGCVQASKQSGVQIVETGQAVDKVNHVDPGNAGPSTRIAFVDPQ
jgi:hypothetical protein